jgi:hypothetical protein
MRSVLVKVIVKYSEDGTIKTIAVPNPDLEGTIQPRTSKGESVAEVDAPDFDLQAEGAHGYFSEVVTRYRVRVSERGHELENI